LRFFSYGYSASYEPCVIKLNLTSIGTTRRSYACN